VVIIQSNSIQQVSPKLKFIIENNRKLKEAMRSGRAVFGTLDTWLLHKLKHVNGLEKFEPVTDVTIASATGHFDPFNLEYISLLLKLCKIKKSMLPRVVDSAFDFGYTHKSLLGAPVKIATIIADQPASLIGNACFRNMDAKVND
jgi:glycerol kinase